MSILFSGKAPGLSLSWMHQDYALHFHAVLLSQFIICSVLQCIIALLRWCQRFTTIQHDHDPRPFKLYFPLFFYHCLAWLWFIYVPSTPNQQAINSTDVSPHSHLYWMSASSLAWPNSLKKLYNDSMGGNCSGNGPWDICITITLCCIMMSLPTDTVCCINSILFCIWWCFKLFICFNCFY